MNKLFLFCFLVLPFYFSYGQSDLFTKKIQLTDSLNTYHPREKLFIHYDKPFYTLKDTLWLKGYIFTADLNKPNDSSRIAYVELINENREVVKRLSLQCFSGTFFGNIFLDDKNFKQGAYVLRAYTNYLRNFGDSLFFESPLKIVDLLAEEWKAVVKEINLQKDRISILTMLKNADQQPLANKRITVRLKSKSRNLLRLSTVTDNSGYIKIDTVFKNPANNDLSFEITDRDNLKLKLPLKINGKEQADLQFFPEGGKFIAGKLQTTGFKAVNIYGKGINKNGVIKDSKGAEVAVISAIHKGMGITSFTPRQNEVYTAYTADGMKFLLPPVENSGTLLQVVHSKNSDSIKIVIDASEDLKGSIFYLSATARGVSAARARLRFVNKPIEVNISKNVFPSGVNRITLYDAKLNPLNERVVFIKHDDYLKITVQPHKEIYKKKDSVHLFLHVQNSRSENVEGSFSVAVIDSGQVKINKHAENIISYMLLSSDLKGHIEEPYYYFNNPEPEALEALMLTQGWVDYTRNDFVQKFKYENTFAISGSVSDIFNKPSRNVNVALFAKVGSDGSIFMDTTTNERGRFVFNRFPLFENDTVSAVIRALNKRGKAFNVGIELDKIDYPPYNADFLPVSSRPIVLDTLVKKYITDQNRIEAEKRKDKEYLGEVMVTTKARIAGSKNLNEDGGSDQAITESALNNLAKESLLDVLYKKVDGFTKGVRPKTFINIYKIHGDEVYFVIDGIDVKWFYEGSSNHNDYIQFLDTYLKYFSGEDIKGIEVMRSGRYKNPYSSRLLHPLQSDWDICYIEITAKTGEGPFMKRTPGVYLYKPLVPVVGKQFYNPKYTPEEESTLPDFRSTIYWAPHVITDKNGVGHISFYTSQSNSGCLIIMQGTDFNGGMGVHYETLKIKED